MEGRTRERERWFERENTRGGNKRKKIIRNKKRRRKKKRLGDTGPLYWLKRDGGI